MKHTKRTISTLIALSLLGASTANAELIIEDGTTANKPVIKSTTIADTKPVFAATPQYKSKNVKESGVRVSSNPVDGWGDNIELSIVLKQIVPDGWKATTTQGLNLSQKITWKANNENWIDVFGKIADANNFKANVDWNNRKIELIGNEKIVSSNIKSSQTSTVAANPNLSAFKNVTVTTVGKDTVESKSGNSFTHPVKTTVSYHAPKQTSYSSYKVWHMSKDKTLRENIESWAQKEGWTVSWGAPDYKVIASFDLYGQLDDPKGPIGQIVESYKTAEQPITARIKKGNKVIRIESRNYNQSPVVATSVGNDYRSAN